MIKLNNKNITYVALADSNNSLKAPKEIWYADSNNSVKLVYRRKDALIEGEDYEKYHWLNGDGSAYIDTNIIYLDGVVDLIAMVEGEVGKLGRERLNDSSDYYSRFVISINPSNGLATVFSSNRADAYITQPLVLQIDVQNDSLTLNGTVKSLDFIPNTEANSIYLFAVNRFNNPTISSQSIIKISKFSISSKINLIPCKLLKPVPKWLDANGIRRQVGECGMIDLVSGKFYGNVNSVGTFTVENYYERKEWLQGRNGAYIDTNYYPIIGTDVFSVHFRYDGTIKNPDGGEQNAFGVNYKISDKSNFIRAYINKNNKIACSYYEYLDNWYTPNIQSDDWDIKDLMINGSKFQYTANGTSYSFNNNGIQQQICPFPLFVFKNNEQVWKYDNYYLHGDISSFKITDTSSNTKMNLIPCTLTMDLPASMDANNIARTKGTSGMWDLVSDRFYGNVANSGTFKAVNLAEGVDYEVYDILKTLAENTSSAPYDVAYFRFPNYISLIGKVLTLKLGNVYRDYNLTGDIVNNARYYILIYRAGLITTIQEKLGNTVLNSVSNSSSTVEIDFDNNVVSVGTSTMNIQGTGYYTFGENNVSWGTEKHLKGLTISDVLNLIPVKLLRSIPSKYDANGIARQAGECGMYDTVNDVFYGNVASSGSFTVSDDS